MSDGFQRNHGRRQEDVSLQDQLDAARSELELTKAMLILTELRLNAALGMPAEQLGHTARDLAGARPGSRQAGMA